MRALFFYSDKHVNVNITPIQFPKHVQTIHFFRQLKNIPVVYLLFLKSCDIIQVKSEQERSEATSVTRIITKGVTRNETVYYGISV